MPRRKLLLCVFASLCLGPGAWGAEVLVVCPRSLQSAIGRWVDFREAQGHRVTVFDDVEAAVRSGSGSVEAERAVVLIGDGGPLGAPMARVPARVVFRYGPEREVLTDGPIAERLGAAVSVGRLPFNDSRSLSAYLDRVIQQSAQPATLGDTRLQIAAGVGGFGPVVDAAIEAAARRLVTELTPPTADVSLRRIDPGDPTGVAPLAADATARGGVWVWLGHGLRHRLPGVANHDLESLTGGADIAVLLACYAGDTTTPGQSVSERLLRSSRGPLVVVASTGVSMPYGNARLGAELLRGVARSGPLSCGDWLLAARTASTRGVSNAPLLESLDSLAAALGSAGSDLSAERAEHAMLYQLFGDPLVSVQRVTPLATTAEEFVASGGDVVVSGTAPIAGRLRMSLRKANRPDQPPFTSAEGAVAAGAPFRVAAALPATVRRGEVVARVAIQGRDGCAVGWRRLRVVTTPTGAAELVNATP